MPSCSWMRSPSGSLVGLTACSFIKRCLYMLKQLNWGNTTEGSAGGTGNHPQKEAPRWRFLLWGCWPHKPCTRRSWLCTRKSYQLKRGSGKVQCSENMAEETCIEILETLKEHLQHRWGSAQLEETRHRTPRMHAKVEYYTQMQVACDHFSSYQGRQQQSREEALRVAREAHCQALAAAAMLKEYIEYLDHSMGHTGASDTPPVASAQEADSTREADPMPGAGVGIAEGRWLHWQTTQRTQVGDRLLCQGQSDLRGGSPLKTPGTLKWSGSDHSIMPKLSFDDPWEWVRWHTCQVDTLAWWPQLVKIPSSKDPISCARQVWASFNSLKWSALGKGKMTTPHHLHPAT